MNQANRQWMMFSIIWCLAGPTQGQAKPADAPGRTLPPEVRTAAQQAIDRGLAFLKSQQNAEGGWTSLYGPAVSAIVARAFVRDANFGPHHPIVERAVAGILRYEQPDGGIYERRRNLANYQTSVVVMLLGAIEGTAHEKRIAKAHAFLTNLQYEAGESIDGDHPWFGGAGYNERKRPDLSNTQMMVEALHQSGLPKDHPVYQRAVKFISRCQLNEQTNDLPFARGRSDGGFVYSPHDGGESKASENLEEGMAPLRSYGSMTYAGFKSLLYANVSRDDPRIRACLKWVRRHYTLESNPNMPDRQSKEGLYYYYYVFAKALDAWSEPVIVDDGGRPHHWRLELCRKLISLQDPDGSWVNRRSRWLEGDANYVTGLTVLTLQTALGEAEPRAKKSEPR